MGKPGTRALVAVIAVARVLVVAGLGYRWWSRSQHTDLARAVAT